MADKGKSDESSTDFEWNWYDNLPGVQTAKSMGRGAKDAADLWEVIAGGDTDPDEATSTSDSGDSDSGDSESGDSDSGDSSDAAPDGDGGLAARTVEPMIPIPIDGGRGQLRIYRDPENEDEPIGVRDSVVTRDGETEIEYAVEVVRGRNEVSDLLSRYSPQPTGSGDVDDGTDAEPTGASGEDGGEDVWVRETTQNPLAGILDSDRFGAQVIRGLGPGQADKGKVDNNVYVNKATGESVIGLENLPEGAKVIDGASVRTVEEGGEAGAETRTENPLGQGLLRMDRGDADKEIDWDGLKPPPAGEREPPGVYEGEGEGDGPDPTDPGKDASLTAGRRNMTDFDPDDSPVNRQAWDMMGGGGRSSTPAGGGGQGSGAGSAGGDAGGRPPGGSGSGTSSTARTAEGFTPGYDPTTLPGGRPPPGTDSDDSGGSSGPETGDEPGSTSAAVDQATGHSSTGSDPAVIGWDYDNDGVVDEWTDTDGNPVPAPEPSTGDDGGDDTDDLVSTSEDPTGESRPLPSREELKASLETHDWLAAATGGRIDPVRGGYTESSGGQLPSVRPGVDQPGPLDDGPTSGDVTVEDASTVDKGDQDPPRDDASPQATGPETANPLDTPSYGVTLPGAHDDSGDEGSGGDEDVADQPQGTTAAAVEMTVAEPETPQPMSYTSVDPDELEHMVIPEPEEDPEADLDRGVDETGGDHTPLLDPGQTSGRTTDVDDNPFD